jgi:hypothetical protein
MAKKEKKIISVWRATAAMSVPSGSCDGTTCSNPPTVAIGALRLCADCLDRARGAYPASFARYWAEKVRPLDAGAPADPPF